MTTRIFLAAGCLLTLALTGCMSDAPPANLIPPAPAEATVEQLSGDYCYFGPEFNLRAFRRSPNLIPFLNAEALGEPTKVSVEATAEEVRFTYTNRDGVEVKEVFSPARFKARWQGGALVVSWRDALTTGDVMLGLALIPLIVASDNVSPQLGGRNRESRLFRLADGRLVMSDTVRASGDKKGEDMASSSWKRVDSVALLFDPAAGDCSGGAGRSPEEWYGHGPDLRVPACADQFEERLASILVAMGESEEVAGRLAGETVESLVNERGSWAQFRIESPPSSSFYGFDVGKSEDGCVLMLMLRVKREGKWTATSKGYFGSALAKRPLPECACN